MTKRLKLIEKILAGKNFSYENAEKILINLGFALEIRGSHHIFRKDGYLKNISLKRRSQLLSYQVEMLKEILNENS